jgi:6-phosphogluconolactonase
MLNSWDERRDFLVAGDESETYLFAAEHWIHAAQRAIQQKGRFAVALSGGSTPRAIYERLALAKIDWSKVFLFWSDERAAPPDHPESNYKMAMESAFSRLPIPLHQIHRMRAEADLEKGALEYEELIRSCLGKDLFDLVMLGVGEDGHTASLFPKTKALGIEDRLCVPNFIPEKNTWRMTLTFSCINGSSKAAIYAIGASKGAIVPKVLDSAIVSPYPASRIGTPDHKALWILDRKAAQNLVQK